MKRRISHRNKKASLQRLVRVALRRWGTDASWHAIAELQLRGSAQTLSWIVELACSRHWRRRALALYVGSQLRRGGGLSSVEFALEETWRLLLAGLQDGRDEVIRAAVSGLGHRPHPAALESLVRLSSHRNEGVRFNVAVSLGHYAQPSAINALLRLATDIDDDVRDWATFGLGSMHDADTPEVREALWRNLGDENEDVRGEALVGLAVRRDGRVVEALLKLLGHESLVYELDAAEALADPRLLPTLRGIADGLAEDERCGYWYGCLQSAIEACRNGGYLLAS